MLDGLTAEFAAGGGHGNLAEALGAGFAGDGCRSLDAGHERVGRQHDEEVDDAGHQHEGDECVEEVAVGDGSAVDVQDERGEVRLANYGSDEGIDEVFDDRVDDGGKRSTDDDGNGEIEYVATQDEITKTFDHRISRLKKVVNRSGWIIAPESDSERRI